MKENISEDNQEFKDEVEIKSLIIRESELGIKTKKSCNYKCWIYLFSVLDIISFILLLVYIFAIKSDVLWLFFSFVCRDIYDFSAVHFNNSICCICNVGIMSDHNHCEFLFFLEFDDVIKNLSTSLFI